MEAYFPVVARQQTLKPSASKLKKEDTGEDRGSCSPYEVADGELGVAETKCSSSTITKRLLATLSDESNPITHSDIRLRSDHIVSFASGHQVAEERVNQRLYLTARERKLSVQREAFSSRSGPSVFKDVKIYIDGYLESTTDIEIKRLVSEGGGQAVPTASACTHIITSRGLSASKTHRLLSQKIRKKPHVVRPEWVLDSLSLGKKRPEHSYAIVKAANTLETFLKP